VKTFPSPFPTFEYPHPHPYCRCLVRCYSIGISSNLVLRPFHNDSTFFCTTILSVAYCLHPSVAWAACRECKTTESSCHRQCLMNTLRASKEVIDELSCSMAVGPSRGGYWKERGKKRETKDNLPRTNFSSSISHPVRWLMRTVSSFFCLLSTRFLRESTESFDKPGGSAGD
jgi:hypothetical protein